MNKILVSIIVPVYNVEKYLVECLESLISQTLKDIEIICINDGSTDNSLNILQEYSLKDNRIIIINKENTGYGNTMNVGLSRATGKYIGIVESDDFAESFMFERLYNIAEKNTVDMVKSNYFTFKGSGMKEKVFIENLNQCKYNRIFCPIDEPEIFFASPSIWTSLYRRDFIINNNIYFNETAGASYQDTSFAFKVLSMAKKVYLTKDAYLYYRIDNMGSSVLSTEKIFCVCDEYKEIENFIQKNYINKAKLRDIKFIMKYRTYKWNYDRLISAFQYAFLLKMYEELKYEFKYKYLDSKYLSEYEVEDLNMLIKNFKKYFELTSKDFKDDRLLKVHTSNSKIYIDALLNEVDHYENIIIYGAGIIGKKVAQFLINNNKQIFSFAISNSNTDQEIEMGINVKSINEMLKMRDTSLILVAVKEKDQFDIINNLEALKFKNIVSIDSLLLRGIC